MNLTLKERVNYNKLICTFIFAVFFSFCNSKASSQENQKFPFNYQKTIWIIHSVDGKGIVYGLPNYYEPKSAFILVRDILTKYVYALEDFPSETSAKDLTPEYLLILMNDVTEQSLLIGNHWISDGKKIAVMQETDFNRLKTILDHREKTDQPPYSKHPTDSLISSFRKGINDNPEGNNYRLKLYEESESQQLLKTTNNSSLASTSQAVAMSSSASTSNLSVKGAIATASLNQTSSLPKLATPAQTEIKGTVEKDDEVEFTFLLSIAAALLIGCVLVWKLKRKN